MNDSFLTYVRDHLAGAQFALSLLEDLREQTADTDAASLAAQLYPDIAADRDVLERYVDGLGGSAGPLRQAAAWVAQKTSRLKLSLAEPLGRFESIEALTLGVQGKMALWDALYELKAAASDSLQLDRLDLDDLRLRASAQGELLERLRRQLAKSTFLQE